MSNSRTFCTVITSSFLSYALALHESLCKFEPNCIIHVLIVDNKPGNPLDFPVGFVPVYSSELENNERQERLFSKYRTSGFCDEYRWSMKPVLMLHLLRQFEKVIYLDADIFFYNDHRFLFDYLDQYHLILTPHWFGNDPRLRVNYFKYLFSHGIYNAGFVGSSRSGKDALEWWSEQCWMKCEKDIKAGYYDDQGYLSVLPALFPKIHVIKHKGCNVSAWNRDMNARLLVNGEVLIQGKDPVVFVHFAQQTIDAISNGEDPLLCEHLNQYEESVERQKQLL